MVLTPGRAGLVLAGGLAGLGGYHLLVRPWLQHWGAEPHEVSRSMLGDGPGDERAVVTTRAVTVAADPADVWPRLVQVGVRGGEVTESEPGHAITVVPPDGDVVTWSLALYPADSGTRLVSRVRARSRSPLGLTSGLIELGRFVAERRVLGSIKRGSEAQARARPLADTGRGLEEDRGPAPGTRRESTSRSVV